MKYARTLGMTVLSAAFLAGCGSVAHVEKDPSVSLDRYHSFAWVETKAGQSDTVKTRVSDLTERNIMSAVNAELQKQGWVENSKRPDVLLTYDVLVENGTRERSDAVYSQPFTRWYYNPWTRRYTPVYYSSQFLGYDRQQEAVREGTVTLRMIDARTDKTVWQGWTTQDVDNRNLSGKEVQAAVRSIFRKFDVASR